MKQMNEITATITDHPSSEIIFSDNPGEWFMKITNEGFKFNRERFPKCELDDFAKAFMYLLEKEYVVKFEKR